MKVKYAPAVAGILRQQKLRQLKALASRLGWAVACVAILYVWMTLE